MGSLTDLKIRTASASGKEVLIADGDGLYLRIRCSSRAWIYRYKQNGVETKLGLGSYPTVSLADARKRARAEAEKRADGIDPKEARRLQQEQERVAQISAFEVVMRGWHAQAKKDRHWSERHANKVMMQISVHLLPWLGPLPIDKILPTDVVKCLHRVRDRGFLETAQRVRSYAEQVFQFAVELGILDPNRNFVTKKTGSLPPPRSRHYPAITDPAQLGQLLRDIKEYSGQFVTKSALRLMPMVFQRPGQLRLAEWKDICFTNRIWRCPPENMKLREWQKRDIRTPAHLVPLNGGIVTVQLLGVSSKPGRFSHGPARSV